MQYVLDYNSAHNIEQASHKISSMHTSTIHINLQLRRGNFTLNADLTLPLQGCSVILGASGSGKTTLLRAMTGLDRGVGSMKVGEECWQDDSLQVWQPVWQRPIGYVFQEPTLMTTMTVEENIKFAQSQGQRRNLARQDTPSNINITSWLESLEIAHLMPRAIHNLSGGERQRVAIARALIGEPKVLLMDEPLSAVDERHRHDLLRWLIRLRREWKLPIIYITHSWEEATQLADYLVLMDQGNIKAVSPIQEWMPNLLEEAHWQQWLSWPERWRENAGVIVEGVVTEQDAAWQLQRVDFHGGHLWIGEHEAKLGDRLRFRILAKDVSLSTEIHSDTSIQNHIHAKITAIRHDIHPALSWIQLSAVSSENHLPQPLRFFAKVTRRAVAQLALMEGKQVWANIKTVAVLD